MNLLRIAGIAIRELLYERVFYVLVAFLIMAIFLSLMLGRLTYVEQAKFTLDFMLAGIEISMVLFAVFMGTTLFQRELTIGSVAMVLSKPISRWSFLLGKFLGQMVMQIVVMIAMLALTMAISSRFGTSVSYVSIAQAGFLIFLEVMVITAATYFFAVISGLVMTAIGALSLFIVGHLRGELLYNLDKDPSGNWLWQMAASILPDLEVFNMKALASYGLVMDANVVGWAAAYAVIYLVFFLTLAVTCFQGRDVLT